MPNNRGSSPSPTISGIQALSTSPTSEQISWSTNQSTTAVVHYGPTSSYGTTVTVSGYTMTHAVSLTGLTPGATYHFDVQSVNNKGQSSTSPDATFTTGSVPPPTPPPTISGVQALSTGNTSEQVGWTTDQSANSTVNYGLTSGYGSSVSDASMVISHAVSLTGLTAGTTYHYDVVSTDSNGTSTSPDATFTTGSVPPPTPPPTISGVQALSTGNTSEQVGWTTDQSANSTVNYGLTSGYGSSVSDASMVISHAVSLTGLTAGTTYHYDVVSTDSNGTSTSPDFTFTAPSGLGFIDDLGVTSWIDDLGVTSWTDDLGH